ncbi:MAG: hypothetical protein ABUS56_01625, partial [Acidobacteriota bacterium]
RTRPHAALLVVAATPLAYVAVKARRDVFAVRFMLLALPFVAAFAGVGTSDVLTRLRARRFVWRGATEALVVAALLADPLARSLYLDLLFTRVDNRRDVERWLRARPGALETAVFDGPAVGAFAEALPSGARVLRNPEMTTAHPETLLGADTRYVVLSSQATSPEFQPLWQLCTTRGTIVFESSPHRTPGRLPEGDDVLAPFHDIFDWQRPGMFVRVFDLHPSAARSGD